MSANSIDSDQYVNGSIDHVHLAGDAVDGDNLADDAVDSEHYTDGSIDTAHLADGQVTTAKLATAVFTGATDIGAAIVDADLFLMDDGAGGTIRKTTAARLKTYAGGLAGVSSSSGNVTIADGNLTFGGSGHGIHLGVTSATAANLLDDYEEGTWEATVATGSGSITVSSSALCNYTKIGRMVQLNGSVTIGSVSSPSGDLLINGKPFGSTGGEGGFRATGPFNLYGASGTGPGLVCQLFEDYASLRVESSFDSDRAQANHVVANCELRFTINYCTTE